MLPAVPIRFCFPGTLRSFFGYSLTLLEYTDDGFLSFIFRGFRIGARLSHTPQVPPAAHHLQALQFEQA